MPLPGPSYSPEVWSLQNYLTIFTPNVQFTVATELGTYGQRDFIWLCILQRSIIILCLGYPSRKWEEAFIQIGLRKDMFVMHPGGPYPNSTACPLSHHCLNTPCPLPLMTLGTERTRKGRSLKSSVWQPWWHRKFLTRAGDQVRVSAHWLCSLRLVSAGFPQCLRTLLISSSRTPLPLENFSKLAVIHLTAQVLPAVLYFLVVFSVQVLRLESTPNSNTFRVGTISYCISRMSDFTSEQATW